MRDWDRIRWFLLTSIYNFIGLHYLWGIETIQPFTFPSVFIIGLHYLWGIETQYNCSLVQDIIGLHYLWGIETFISSTIGNFLNILGLHYLWGIETIKLRILSAYDVSDYITYEGLRQFCHRNPVGNLRWRITLPMRDWDIIGKNFRITQIR